MNSILTKCPHNHMIRYNNLYNIHYVCLLPIVYQNMRTINFLTSYPEEKYRHTLKTITRNITKYNKITNNYIINVFHEHRRPLFYSHKSYRHCVSLRYTHQSLKTIINIILDITIYLWCLVDLVHWDELNTFELSNLGLFSLFNTQS